MWEEILPIERNGIITEYEVLYEPLREDLSPGSINTTDLNVIILGLQEFIFYNIFVRAYTSVGPGPYSCLLYTSPSPRDATLSRMPSTA